MPQSRLDYGDFRRVTEEEDAISFKAKRFINPVTGENISGAEARKRAGSQAPSRLTVSERAELDHTPSTPLTNVTEAPKISQTLRNRRAFAETYGISLREASQSVDLRFYNKEWQSGLKRLQKFEQSRKRKDPQSAEEQQLRASMNDIAKSLGRKAQDDYTDFGSTDTIA